VRSTGANAYASDGTVIIGGSFTIVGDAAQSGLAVLVIAGPMVPGICPAGSSGTAWMTGPVSVRP
jgi:hypothetical protein